MIRLTTDEEVNRWRITPRKFESDAEDALTRLAIDYHALTAALATAKRDSQFTIDGLRAEIATANQAITKYEREVERLDDVIAEANADNLRLRNERDGAWAEGRDAAAKIVDERVQTLRASAASVDALVARDRRDADDYDRMADSSRREARDLEELATELRALKRPSPGTERDGAWEALTDARAWILECYEAWSPIMPFSGAYTGGELSRMAKIEAALKRPSPGTEDK